MLSDIKRNVVTTYKADTSQMKKSIKDLRDETEKLGNEQKSLASSIGKFGESSMAAWSKAGVAVGVVTGAVMAGKEAWEAYAKHQKLAAAAGKVDLDSLSKAAGGQLTQMKLLEFAAKAQAGATKLNAQQMETAVGAMRAMTRAGFEQEEVTKKVTDAILKLEGDGLKDFGVRVREATGDADKFNAIMEALGAQAKTVDGAVQDDSEAFKGLGVEFQDAFDKIKVAIGSTVKELAPLIKSLAEVVGLVAELAAVSSKGAGLLVKTSITGASSMRSLMFNGMGLMTDVAKPDMANVSPGLNQGMNDAERARLYGDMGTSRDEAVGRNLYRTIAKLTADNFAQAYAEEVKRNGGRWAEAAATRDARAVLDSATYEKATGGTATGGLGAAADTAVRDEYGREVDLRSLIPKPGNIEAEYNAVRDKQSKSFLEESFGPIEEFNAYATAFGLLTGAVTSAMSAWIDGSMSAGDAVKKFLGEAMKGLATSMAVEALKHGAYALGYLAFGDVRGAGQHAAAAAAFGVGAAAAAVAAKELGNGGTAYGKGAGATGGAAPTFSGSGAASGGGPQPIIVIGNSFVEGGPRQRQLQAEKLVAAALGSNAVVYG